MPEQAWAGGQSAAVSREAGRSAWGRGKGHVPCSSSETAPWDRPLSSKQPMQPCPAFTFPMSDDYLQICKTMQMRLLRC